MSDHLQTSGRQSWRLPPLSAPAISALSTLLLGGWLFAGISYGSAAEFTPAQLQQFQQLSPAQQQALAAQAGINIKQTVERPEEIITPSVVQPQPQPEAPVVNAIESGMRERICDSAERAKAAIRGCDDLAMFGYSLFAGAPTTFAPATEIPIPPEYVLGPGDEMKIQYYGSRSDSLTLVIDREGVIELPDVGTITLAGLSFIQARAIIAGQVRQKLIGVTISVAMGRLRSIRVFVLGDVNYPGSYLVSGLSTISNALFVSGGVSKRGSLRQIQLKRGGRKVATLDLYDFLLQGDSHGDVRLMPGDVIFVPPIGRVAAVAGEVVRPGIYEIKDRRTIDECVAIAGGLLPTGDATHVQIDRLDRSGQRSFINATLAGRNGSAQLQNGDIVLLYPRPQVTTEFVLLSGAVKRPGRYGWKKGMRLTDLIASRDTLMPNTYLEQAEITRYRIMGGEKRVSRHFQVDLEAALDGVEKANIPLEPYDVLNVRQVSNWRASEHIAVSGEFKFPGTYPIEEGERLSALIERAGGFTPKAYLKGAVFTRESIRAEQQKQLDELAKKIEADIERQAVSISDIKDASLLKRQQQDLEVARSVLQQMREVEATGRLVIRLVDADRLKGSDFDLSLRDGDTLYVPQRPDQVLVLGQVYNQTALLYRHDFDRDDYIDLAGGTTKFADTGEIYVMRANGEVDARRGWRASRIQPGDTIVVPEELERFHFMDSLLDWSRVLGQVGLAVAAFKSVGIL
ncbi:MAG: SLBB domain-containing protein [Methyloligellaceae bacterium]